MEISQQGNQTFIWFMTSFKIRKSLDCKCLRGVLKLQVTEAVFANILQNMCS